MAGTVFGLPFDEELFMQMWSEISDPVRTAVIDSGALVSDGNIHNMIQNDGNLYTIPFYNTLSGDALNYDGVTNNEPAEIDGTYQSGIVYGRMKAWMSRDFAAELSGGDPMGHIVATQARYWNKQKQKTLIEILSGVFGITGSSGNKKKWQDNNTSDLSSSTATPYTIGATDINNAITQAAGDNKSEYSLAIMHSSVAKTLENLDLLEFRKYTDISGIQRTLNIADINGLTVVIDDGVPVETVGGEGANKDLSKYTTYLLGNGVLRQADARLEHAVETDRNPEKYGGVDILYTKIRETIHPNGFTWKGANTIKSPTNAQLATSTNWDIVFDPKSIAMCRLITNG